MRLRLVAVAGCVAVLVALAFVLVDAEPRQAGSNYVPEFAEALTLRGTDQHCQAKQTVPKDAAALRLLIGTYGRPAPRVDVRVDADGERLSSGRLPEGVPQGHVVIAVTPVERTTPGVTVCVHVQASKGRRTVLYGTLGQVRFEWLREGRESWFELLPTVVHRFSLGKANPVGEWLLLVAGLLLALAAGAALRLGIRELRGA